MRISTLIIVALSLVLSGQISAQNAKPATLDELLKQVKQGRIAENKENAAREKRFKADKASQARKIEEAKALRVQEELRSEQMENTFDENEQEIIVLQDTLNKRLGSLKELFGVLQQAAGDARGQFENSMTNIQYPDRGEFLTDLAQKMGSSSKLASIEEIERLWFEIQREMTESGRVVKFNTNVILGNGEQIQKEIVRIGVFNLVADGEYLVFETATGNVTELPGQKREAVSFGFKNGLVAAIMKPAEIILDGIMGLFPDPWERYRSGARALQSAEPGSGFVALASDPTRGQLLSAQVQKPEFSEQVDAGGEIGYIIIFLGVFAVILAVLRWVWLFFIGIQVSAQKRNLTKPGNNPLGRVLKVYEDSKGIDIESLELKLSEAVLKETPKLNRFNTILKVIAVIAPLMGLLGTVTGMIVTFQSITLYGTGDPKIMAGGISQALVTTVEGLCVAIPVTLLYTLVSGRSRRLVQILEEQTTGLIAVQSEQAHGSSAA